MRLTVLILNNHWLVRRAWSFILASDPRFRVIAECNDFESALVRARNLQPDLILLDSDMDGLDGIDLEPFVQMFSSTSKVLGITGQSFSFFRLNSFQKKQGRQVSKKIPIQRLFQALQELKPERAIEFPVMQSTDTKIDSDHKYLPWATESFSIYELEIIAGVLNHLSLKEISLACRMPQGNVKKHLARIIKDLRLNNISELIQFILKTNGIFNRLAMTIDHSAPGKQAHERTWGPALHWN
ncbi:MAG: DNA-binding response regulator [Flavisolibacter sp.]